MRILAFAETGKAPSVPAPLLRAPVGTTVHLTVHNRSDSALTLGGLRRSMTADRDTVQLAAGATREVTFKLDKVGNFFYWAALKGLSNFDDRNWLDSQLTGGLIVDAAGAAPATNERVWVITEWFYPVEKTQTFESALTFNGKEWPYNERLTFTQGDSVHFRIINAAAIEHPLHLHGFYFRVTRHGGARADTVVAPAHAAAAEHAHHPDRRIAVAGVPADDAGQLGVPLPFREPHRRDREPARLARGEHHAQRPAAITRCRRTTSRAATRCADW